MKTTLRSIALVSSALAVATAIWLPALHLFYRPRVADFHTPEGVPPMARALANHHLRLWSDEAARAEDIQRMRWSNAEWDFMGRTYLVLALANLALRSPDDADESLRVMDLIIDETLRLEREHGIYYFLMDYARQGVFMAQPARSLFQDGEIALMLAARRVVRERDDYRAPMTERIDHLIHTMSQSPVLCGESYPNEGWMFCNAIAIAAIRAADALDATDHSVFIDRWLESVQTKMTDAETGLLISSFCFNGLPDDGPEGSSIWMVSHTLALVAPGFAADQYRRAKRELEGRFFGFGYAREWPAAWRGPTDIDSGPIVPVLDISAGSSGLAILGAAAFNDDAYLRRLLTTLRYGGFPARRDGELRFLASNQVGDAVLLYAALQGPLWKEIDRRWEERK